MPIMMLCVKRHQRIVSAKNSFEADIYKILDTMSSDRIAALRRNADAYYALQDEARDCIYETRFDRWPDSLSLNGDFLMRSVAHELVTLGQKLRHGGDPFEQPSPGDVRVWKQSFDKAGEPGQIYKLDGPWPWICAITPTGALPNTNQLWFSNQSRRIPGDEPFNGQKFAPEEFDWDCVPINPPDSANFKVNCGVPGGRRSGGGFGGCKLGVDYEVPNGADTLCLRVPQAVLGDEIGLRGLNFFTQNIDVLVEHLDDNMSPTGRFTSRIRASDVHGDHDEAKKALATCGVRDRLYFRFPAKVQKSPTDFEDVEVPPGFYRISIIVPNEIAYAPVAGQSAPSEFRSNSLSIEMLPNDNKEYALHCSAAFCEEETSGLGGDEPWFKTFAMTAHLPQGAGATGLSFAWPNGGINIFDTDDVDSGEWIPVDGTALFAGRIPRDQVLAVALIGLEVDDRDLAKKEINDAQEAFFEFFRSWFGLLSSGGESLAIGGAVTAVVGKVAAAALYVFGAGMGGIFLLGMAGLWAEWERADLIAYDMFVLTGRDVYNLTDPDQTLAPQPSDDRIRGLRQVEIHTEPLLPKEAAASGVLAIYKERRTYFAPVEESRYRLDFKFERLN